MATRYKAVAPLVVVKDRSGADHYAYKGQIVAGDFDPAKLKALAEDSFLEEAAEPAAAPDEPAEATFDGPPAKSATLDVWRAFAKSEGMDEAEAEKAKKKDLVELYLGAGDGDEGGQSDNS